MILWPARIVTPQATYEPAHLRQESADAEILNKAGELLATLDGASRSLVAEGQATGRRDITQRWQFVGASGERWLVELTTGCGCGGTRVTGTNSVELQW